MTDTSQQLNAFLDHLHRGGTAGYYWTVDKKQKKQSYWWNGTGRPAAPNVNANLYFGVHPTTEIPKTNADGEPRESKYLRSRNTLIASLNCLFSEFDAKDYNGDLDAAMAAVEALKPRPSVVVASGGGYHCYWLLAEPWVITSDADRERARQVLYTWVDFTGGDGAAKDLARVLRVPGSLNYKYNPPQPVEFVWCETERVYQRADLIACVERFWAQGKLDLAVQKVHDAPDGRKHNELLKASRLAGGVADILGERAVEDALFNEIKPRAADPRNAAQTIRDGINYGRNAPLKLDTDRTAQFGERPTKSQTIVTALRNLGYSFRLNLCSNTIEVNDQVLDDIIAARIRTEMRDLDFTGKSAIEDTYTTEAARNAYHPIKDYLNSLEWDGQPHIEKLSSMLQCDDASVDYGPDHGTVPLAGVYLWRWLIGSVAKVFEHEQNMMLVLAGSQGIGKSAFARWLCSCLPDYFIEAPINVQDKDTDVRLMERFIWEVSELDATTRKADVSALKAFITKQTVTVRKSYGHHDTVKPAIASFIGTVNDGVGFLADETGNRRFYVTRIRSIDWSYTKLDIHQIWAQAVALYRRGEPWRLLPIEVAAQSATNREHEVDGLLEDWIPRYFHLDMPDAAMSAAEIVDHLRKNHDIHLSGTDRAQAMEIARVMTKLDIAKRQRTGRGVREYMGIHPK